MFTVVWEPEKTAGFALLALLSGDRDLAQVAPAVPAHLLSSLRARVDAARQGEDGVRALLSLLRPELDTDVALLPVRIQAPLSRLARAALRKQLASAATATRADFRVDEDLLAALSRIARSAALGGGR